MRFIVIVAAMMLCFIAHLSAYAVAIVDRVETTERIVALSIVGVESKGVLEGLLRLSQERHIHLTVFIPSQTVENHAGLIKKAMRYGVELGECGVKNQPWDDLRSEDIKKELLAAQTVIFAKTGIKPKVIRPPDFRYSHYFLAGVAEAGVDAVVVRGVNLTAEALVLKKDAVAPCFTTVASGDILNVNVEQGAVSSMLPQFIRNLQQAGFGIVSVSELLRQGVI